MSNRESFSKFDVPGDKLAALTTEIHPRLKSLISLRRLWTPTQRRQEASNATSVLALRKSEPGQAASLQKLSSYLLIQRGTVCRNLSELTVYPFLEKPVEKFALFPVKFSVRLFSLKFPNVHDEFSKSFSDSVVNKNHLKQIKSKNSLI